MCQEHHFLVLVGFYILRYKLLQLRLRDHRSRFRGVDPRTEVASKDALLQYARLNLHAAAVRTNSLAFAGTRSCDAPVARVKDYGRVGSV